MTSIEWLDEQIQEHVISQDLVAQNLIIQISISDYLELKRQAKEMHKQEIIKSYEFGQNDGWNTRENDYNKNYHKKGTAESYYNYEFNYKYGEL